MDTHPMVEMPDLHEVVLAALDLHASYRIPEFLVPPARKYLVVASGNALPTARVLFADLNAIMCDEGQYRAVLDQHPDIDSAFVLSASGTKHAPLIVADLLARRLETRLITCAPQSPAASLLPSSAVYATRSLAEPITYNTSTYMGMMLMKTREDPAAIKHHLIEQVKPMLASLGSYEAYYLIVPPQYEVEVPMFVTKFDELFGGRVNGRCYTLEQTMHAKTVIPWEKELFVSFGVQNVDFGSARLQVPLPADASFVGMMATGYYVIGHIQAQKYPWFRENAEAYAAIQRRLFDNGSAGSV